MISRADYRNKTFRLSDIPEELRKDPNDCHKIPFLDHYIGRRATIVTKKGTVKGHLEYMAGWYYCQAPFYLVDGQWIFSHKRFCFRKGEFKSIKQEPIEGSLGL